MTSLPIQRAKRADDAILFATSLPLWVGTLLSDWAYAESFNIQWSNFASCLNAGALVIVAAALVWALIARFTGRRGRRRDLYLLTTGGVFLVGFINSLVHAKDAWASMPMALILSVVIFLLALAAAWIGMHADEGEVA